MRFIGGLRYGASSLIAMNASWPLAQLQVLPNLMLLTSPLKKINLTKDEIIKISRHPGFFSTGIRIEHSVPDYQPFVVFWTFKFQKVKSALIQNGYRFS